MVKSKNLSTHFPFMNMLLIYAKIKALKRESFGWYIIEYKVFMRGKMNVKQGKKIE